MGNPTATGQIEDDRRLRGHADFRRASALTDLKLYREAIPYAQRAAAAGSPSAQLLLGRAYHFGLGTPKDLAQAARLYRASADGGLPDGAWGLAYMHEFGLGVPADRKTALVYYDRAAAGGNQRAKQAAANLRSPDYDAPRNQRSGGGSSAQCGGSYSYNYASGSCSPMVPGLQPYNP
jgi:TPR repeat protein